MHSSIGAAVVQAADGAEAEDFGVDLYFWLGLDAADDARCCWEVFSFACDKKAAVEFGVGLLALDMGAEAAGERGAGDGVSYAAGSEGFGRGEVAAGDGLG